MCACFVPLSPAVESVHSSLPSVTSSILEVRDQPFCRMSLDWVCPMLPQEQSQVFCLWQGITEATPSVWLLPRCHTISTCPVTDGTAFILSHDRGPVCQALPPEAALSPFAIISISWAAGTLKLCKSVFFLIKRYLFVFITLDSRSDFMTGNYH